MSKFTIWTIDNVLVDDTWRLPFIDIEAPAAYRRTMFDAVAFDDQPITTPEFEEARDMDLEPIFIVDRPRALREQVGEWITDNMGVERPCVIMRHNKDCRPIRDFIIDGIHAARELCGIGPGDVHRAFIDDRKLAPVIQREFGIETTIICRSAMSLASRGWCYNEKVAQE
jgi:hypothetical protein